LFTKKKMNKRINALCIVAHPDDETIWMGGTILKNQDWNWTILSLCRKDDKDRAPKFKEVCKLYNAKPIIENLDDKTEGHVKQNHVTDKILSALPKKNYDYIFTHGENGEYGHARHIDVHKTIKKLIKTKQLSCDKLFFFSIKNNNGKISLPKTGELINKLSKSEFIQKRNIMKNLYGFSPNSPDVLYCQQTEVFSIK
jgi:LmbE family N-acetylglucosaminyl deacetylase